MGADPCTALQEFGRAAKLKFLGHWLPSCCGRHGHHGHRSVPGKTSTRANARCTGTGMSSMFEQSSAARPLLSYAVNGEQCLAGRAMAFYPGSRTYRGAHDGPQGLIQTLMETRKHSVEVEIDDRELLGFLRSCQCALGDILNSHFS